VEGVERREHERGIFSLVSGTFSKKKKRSVEGEERKNKWGRTREICTSERNVRCGNRTEMTVGDTVEGKHAFACEKTGKPGGPRGRGDELNLLAGERAGKGKGGGKFRPMRGGEGCSTRRGL